MNANQSNIPTMPLAVCGVTEVHLSARGKDSRQVRENLRVETLSMKASKTDRPGFEKSKNK